MLTPPNLLSVAPTLSLHPDLIQFCEVTDRHGYGLRLRVYVSESPGVFNVPASDVLPDAWRVLGLSSPNAEAPANVLP